jgi:DNA polymerase-3 subunit epsilon
MLLRLERPLVVLDFETTGLDPETVRIVELGFVKLMPDGSRISLCERVDPGIDIPEHASKVHGIRTEDVRGLFGKPTLGKLGGRLLDLLHDCDLAGFNSIAYDVPLWLAECRRHKLAFELGERHQIDAKVIFHVKETGWDRFLMGPRNLHAALRHYCGSDTISDFEGVKHGAHPDCEATILVLEAQLQRYPDLPRTVPELARFCAEAAARERKAG